MANKTTHTLGGVAVVVMVLVRVDEVGRGVMTDGSVGLWHGDNKVRWVVFMAAVACCVFVGEMVVIGGGAFLAARVFWSGRSGIHQSPRGIFINQFKYALDILKKHGMEKCDGIGTTMATQSKLDVDLSGTPVD
ncbi:hypothetical protein Tco_0869214 [Tanacetum coccineum]